MGKFIKQGMIVVILSGRFAGRKAVVLRTYDDASKTRKFGHALVAGIDRAPRKVTRAMSDKKTAKKLRLKPFVKFVNFNHMMPTRYALDISEKLSAIVTDDSLAGEQVKDEMIKQVRGQLEDRYKKLGEAKNEKYATGVQYFFRKLKY